MLTTPIVSNVNIRKPTQRRMKGETCIALLADPHIDNRMLIVEIGDITSTIKCFGFRTDRCTSRAHRCTLI